MVDAPQTAYPLFLRAVLEELVVFGQYEKLDARIDELLQSPDVVDVYTYKIDRMQANVDENYVKDILSFMWVSRAGLATDELVALIGVPKQTFDEIKEALGGFLIDRSGLLDFIDPMLREAVQKVFLSHKAFERDCRKRLARFLEERYEPDSERYVEAAWQYTPSFSIALLRSSGTTMTEMRIHIAATYCRCQHTGWCLCTDIGMRRKTLSCWSVLPTRRLSHSSVGRGTARTS